ncbi:CbtB domain-containing protein [Pseudomonas syringae]|uniref:Cobalt transporter subunit CbtB n=1 Tax=Pseudomonas syringae pv. aceris TaxID=199198 RepID=A0A0P9HBS9_PSESX|nr:CbtB-domain containing protein [Pseudomonas syringae]KPW09205.1 Uncharacterized protein ALO91_03392 [Pseudomonas syringae pv. aceris]
MKNVTAASRHSGVAINPIPVAQLLPWAAMATLLCMLAIYFVGAEQGATSMVKGTGVHELVHDARHTLGFPCH